MKLTYLLLACLAVVFVVKEAQALDPGEKCELQKLKALRDYSHCFLKAGRKQLKKSLAAIEHDALLDSCDADFKAKFEKAVAKAAKKGASCLDDASDVVKVLRESLTTAEIVASSQDPRCTVHDSTTTRCVFEKSHLPWNMQTWVNNNFSTTAQGTLLVTAEAWGAKGQGGDGDGSKGSHGYAQTTWYFDAFGASTDLYIYVGEQPDCNSCGGSSSMILFKPLEDNPGVGDALLVAGGGGGGGNGGNGGDGGRVVAGTSRASAPGGGNGGGNQDGNGQGGSGNANCSSTGGESGIGGYGGIKGNNTDDDRAGWNNASSPAFSAYGHGSGGTGEKADSSGDTGAGGGGGYGGGGGNCDKHGGGGGGSLAAALMNESDGTAKACGSAQNPEVPNSGGNCGKGGEGGVVALNFRVTN